MKKNQKTPMSETADEAMKNYEQALRNGLKFQEETWQWWCAILNESLPGQDWQKRFSQAAATANDIIPAAQKRWEETRDLMEKNVNSSADLLKKAAEATRAPNLADSQSKWIDFWRASLEASRANTEAMMHIGSRAFESWVTMVRKASELGQPNVSKAA